MACFVFRINYAERYQMVHKEILNGKLRQGWGAYGMRVDIPVENFKEAWYKNWGTETEEDKIESRYYNVKIMTEINIGDLVIVPKVSLNEAFVCRSFTILRCTGTYGFEVLNGTDDFGHYIEVEDVLSCSYDLNELSYVISGKFIAYQSPLNRVKNNSFIEAVDKLIELKITEPERFEKESETSLAKVASATVEARQVYLSNIVNVIQNWPNKKLEIIIQELFAKNGYVKTDNNWYDGEGGDVDIAFKCFAENTLMENIYSLCDDTEMPEIFIQAKKKTGTDNNDINGIMQLLKMAQKVSNKPILIVINLTSDFTNDAKRLAKDEGVILINGIMFASLLVRYGIDI